MSAARKVWNGELEVEQKLNAEVTTAFPVDQAIGTLAPGVYVMTATPKGASDEKTTTSSRPNGSSSPISASPPIRATTASHVFVHSLASAEPKRGRSRCA